MAAAATVAATGAVVGGVVPVASGSSATALAHLCDTPNEHILTTTPKVTELPNGAVLRVWKSGGLKINEVYVPASSPLRLQVWTSHSLTNSEQPTKVLAAHKTGVAVMNADVFDASRGAIPYGVEVTQGVVRKAERQATNAVVISATGHQIGQGLVSLTGKVTAAGNSEPVTGLNWQDIAGSGINIYTAPWGGGSHPAGSVDVVVKSGKVVDVRHSSLNSGPRSGTQVLTGSGDAASFLDKLRVGQSVVVKYGFSTSFHYTETPFKVYDAVDHDTPYWLDGAEWQVNCGDSPNLVHYDRTGLGSDRKGDFFLVTTSGSGSTSSDLEYYLGKLGSYNADGFDNDTSTTMAVRTKLGGPIERVDKPNGSYQRAVPNDLGIG